MNTPERTTLLDSLRQSREHARNGAAMLAKANDPAQAHIKERAKAVLEYVDNLLATSPLLTNEDLLDHALRLLGDVRELSLDLQAHIGIKTPQN